jgi:hypothetical protein
MEFETLRESWSNEVSTDGLITDDSNEDDGVVVITDDSMCYKTTKIHMPLGYCLYRDRVMGL